MDINKIIDNQSIKEVVFLKEIDSTNDYAKTNEFEDTTLIITDKQTKGRGTGNRVWYTEAGKSITMSIVAIPNCNISELDGLTIRIAKEIKAAIKEGYNIDLLEKMPNDLLLNNKKVCGILTETVLSGQTVKKLIIGIGFNVNQEYMNEEIKGIATSLKIEMKKDFCVEDVICMISDKIFGII